MSFVHTSLLAVGLPLVAIPLLIHLINLRRHRRIHWAAMEFLLQSQKRHRKWILLKQWLLLALRMTAIAALVMMLAQPILQQGWGALLGSATTHHILLVDDSFSMSDRGEGDAPLDQAKRVVDRIAKQAVQRGGNQLFTLLRFSEAARLTVGAQPDLYRQSADTRLGELLQSELQPAGTSQRDDGPLEALEAVARLPEPDEGEQLIVYLISDFRARDWRDSDPIQQQLATLSDSGAEFYLIHCAAAASPNLAITQLRPEQGLRASEVEMWMELRVANFSDAPARDVTLQIEEDGASRGAIELDAIPPWQELPHRFRVRFPTAGPHQITASLAADTVAADNRRFFAADVPTEFTVLIIDGSERGRDGYYLQRALAPGGPTKTGWRPQVEPPGYLLRQPNLQDVAAILLLDVPRLDAVEVEVLEEYLRGGGGVAFFVGDNTDGRFVTTQLYREGQGMFPAPLDVPTQLRRARGDAGPDIRVSKHPLFQVLSGTRNSFLPLILVDFYFAVEPGWRSDTDASVTELAWVRDGSPWALERRVGDGRVVALLTKLAPDTSTLGRWSNWSLNPAFPVLMNELVGYLASDVRLPPPRMVGDDIELSLDSQTYGAELRWMSPAAEGEDTSISALPQDDRLVASLPTTTSGVHMLELPRRDGRTEQRLIAVNVVAGEGDLRTFEEEALDEALTGVPFRFAWAESFVSRELEIAGFQLTDALLYTLIGVLLGEQLLAYAASYHPKARTKIAS